MKRNWSDYDYVGQIISFEQGELPESEVIRLFQCLVDTGMAWTLQGSYGRAAMALIEQGLIAKDGNSDPESGYAPHEPDATPLTPEQYKRLFEVCVQVYMVADGTNTVPEYAARSALEGEPVPVLVAMLPDDIDWLVNHEIHFDPTTGEAWEPDEYVSLQDCVSSGKHLKSCDNDGYCNFCGEQEGAEYD